MIKEIQFRIVNILNDLGEKKAFAFGSMLVFLALGLVFSDFLSRPVYHDEGHFLEAIKLFASRPVFEVIPDYPEVTPPLFYLIYSGWGKLFGFDLTILRMLSLILGIGVILLLRMELFQKSGGFISVSILMLFMLFNPYFLGSGFLIYTDILGLFFLLILIQGVHKENFLMIIIGASCALLTRQYLAFAVAGAGISFLRSYIEEKKVKDLMLLFALGMACIPLFYLVYLWGGLAPSSGILKWNPESEFMFNTSYVTTYFAFIGVYLLPLILMLHFKIRKWHLALAVLGLGWYMIFPVEASAVAREQMGISTVGIAHKILVMAFGEGLLLHVVLCMFFLVGLIWVLNLLIARVSKDVFSASSVAFFMTIMPFSYQVWEKYLIVLIPFLLLLVTTRSPEGVPQPQKIQDLEG